MSSTTLACGNSGNCEEIEGEVAAARRGECWGGFGGRSRTSDNSNNAGVKFGGTGAAATMTSTMDAGQLNRQTGQAAGDYGGDSSTITSFAAVFAPGSGRDGLHGSCCEPLQVGAAALTGSTSL